MRPHIWPLPISLRWPAALAKPTIVSTSPLSDAPENSGAVASAVVGRGGRVPTFTAGGAPALGGSVTPNHGPSFFAGAARGASSCPPSRPKAASARDAETASESTTTAVARLFMAAILPAFAALRLRRGKPGVAALRLRRGKPGVCASRLRRDTQ